MRAAVLTISDRCAAGTATDESGPLLAQLAIANGAEIVATEIVADERVDIERVLRDWADANVADLILTTGGTGLAPRDVTPEATRAVIEREAPGIAEGMRAAGMAITPLAMLSRQVVGQRKASLIVNFPGSPKAVREGYAAVAGVLPRAVSLVMSGACL